MDENVFLTSVFVMPKVYLIDLSNLNRNRRAVKYGRFEEITIDDMKNRDVVYEASFIVFFYVWGDEEIPYKEENSERRLLKYRTLKDKEKILSGDYSGYEVIDLRGYY